LIDREGLVVSATVDAGWRMRPVRPLDPASQRRLEAESRWGRNPAPTSIDAADLSRAQEAAARNVFTWRVIDTDHVAVLEPISRAGWSYAAALPVVEVESEASSFLHRAVGGALLGLIGAFVLARIVSRRVVRSIHRLIDLSRRVVTDNDLTQSIDISSEDEVGELAASFSSMVAALRDAMNVLQNASASLLGAADQLRQTTEAEREFVARQTSALQETQITAQEIKQTSMLASDKANLVVKAAEGADEMGRSGEGAVQQSIAGLDSIRSQTDAIGEQVQVLAESAREIGQVTETVKDLADQSNMLALNAAIEAVRSGDHGKGFAVVAREIRMLADQSIAATRRVSEILTAIGGSIQTTAKMSEKGAHAVAEGVHRITQSGDTVRGLVSITRQNVDAARQIAAAVAQQNAGIQQIFVAVTDQLQMMAETQKRLERTTVAAATVREQAAHVSGLLARYRL
jgi:methyl-accepting chemotaxis protein